MSYWKEGRRQEGQRGEERREEGKGEERRREGGKRRGEKDKEGRDERRGEERTEEKGLGGEENFRMLYSNENVRNNLDKHVYVQEVYNQQEKNHHI